MSPRGTPHADVTHVTVEAFDEYALEFRPATAPYARPKTPGTASRPLHFIDTFTVQCYGDVLVSLLVAVPLLAWLRGANVAPKQRPVFINDVTVSYPAVGDNQLPDWVAGIVVPFLLLLTSVITVELIWLRRQHIFGVIKSAYSLHFLLQGACAWLLAVCCAEVLRRLIGYPRPQYLSRCQPSNPSYPTQFSSNSITTVDCTQPDAAYLRDAQLSFPSDSVTAAATLSAFIIVHLLSGLYGERAGLLLHAVRSRGVNFLRDLAHSAFLVWIIGVFFFPWYVAATRVNEYLHSTADVTAGLLLGSLVGTGLGVRAVLRSRVISEALTVQ